MLSYYLLLFTGYWPSYNVPFFESVYNLSGYPAFVEAHGLGYSYQLAARAKIYRRDQDNVTSLETLKSMMRYNGKVLVNNTPSVVV